MQAVAPLVRQLATLAAVHLAAWELVASPPHTPSRAPAAGGGEARDRQQVTSPGGGEDRQAPGGEGRGWEGGQGARRGAGDHNLFGGQNSEGLAAAARAHAAAVAGASPLLVPFMLS